MCWVADIMSNFFIARKSRNGFKKIGAFSSILGFSKILRTILIFGFGRTSTAGSVRMDPTFSKTAHREFFLDAIGRLRVAFCAKGFVGHSPEVPF